MSDTTSGALVNGAWGRFFSRRGEPSVPLAMVAAVLIWGAAFSGVKVVVDQLGPAGLTAARSLTTALAFTVLHLAHASPRPDYHAGDTMRLAVAGIASVAGYSFATAWGMQYVSAGVASVIVSTTPLMVALLARITIGEPMGRRRVAGMLLALVGVGVISVAAGGGFTARRVAGLAVLLLAPFSWALYTVVTKPMADRYDPVRLNLIGAWAAVAVTSPFLVSSRDALLALPLSGWLWLAYLGGVVGGISMVVYAWALRRWSAAGIASFAFLVPVAGVLWAWALLDETPSPGMVSGGLLVIAGLVLVWRSRPVSGWAPMLYRRLRQVFAA